MENIANHALFKATVNIYEQSEVCALIVDSRLNMLWCNNQAAKKFPALAVKNGLSSHIESEHRKLIAAALESGRPYICPADPAKGLPFACCITPIGDESSKCLFASAVISAPKAEALSADGDFSMALSSFYSTVREPSFYIFSALSSIAHRCENAEDYTSLKYVNEAAQNTYAILRSISHMVEYIRDANGIAKHSPAPRDLRTFIADLYRSAEAAARSTEIPFSLSAPLNPVICNIDEQSLSIAVLNILLNSFVFSKEGNEITLSLKQAGANAVITISDKGIGIAPDKMDRIFDAFYSGNEDRSTARGGLGLTLANSIVLRHGGRITASSAENGGTVIAISLPVLENYDSELLKAQSSYVNGTFSPVSIELCELGGINII